MISRRKFLSLLSAHGWLALPRSVGKVPPALGSPESKPLRLQAETRSDGPPGFCVLVSVSGNLRRWLQDPTTPKRDYGWMQWMTDDPENELPVDAETVERWKGLLRQYAPTSYRQLFFQ